MTILTRSRHVLLKLYCLKGVGTDVIGAGIRCLFRRVGIVGLCYALALQPLIVSIGTANLAAAGVTEVLLCQSSEHDPSGPSNQTDRYHTAHCIYCFPGAHIAAVLPPDKIDAGWIAGESRDCVVVVAWQVPSRADFSLARPRGPPNLA